jgi:hypothetical protein
MEDTLARTLVRDIHMGKPAQSGFKSAAWTAVAYAVNQILPRDKPLVNEEQCKAKLSNVSAEPSQPG